MEFSEKDQEAVKWCEDNYTEITDEYKNYMGLSLIKSMIKTRY